MTVFAEQWSDVLGAVHGLLAIVMVISFVMGAIFLYAVSVHNWKHIQIAGLTASLTYIATFVMGLLVYPRFRVYVRGRFLDERAPNSTGLFEIKEHLAALGLFIALALLVLIAFGRLRRANTWRRQLYGALFCILSILALVVTALAYVLASRKP